jgi:hypothetical protein
MSVAFEHFQRRSFTGAVGTENAEDFAGLMLSRDAIDRIERFPLRSGRGSSEQITGFDYEHS